MKSILALCFSILGIATAATYEHPYPQVYAPTVVPAYYPPVSYAPSPAAAGAAPSAPAPYNRDVPAYDYSKYPAASPYNRDVAANDPNKYPASYAAASPYSSYAPASAAQPTSYYSPAPASTHYYNYNYAPVSASGPVAAPAPVAPVSAPAPVAPVSAPAPVAPSAPAARPYTVAAPPPNTVEAYIFTPAQVVGYAPGPAVGASTAYGKWEY